jgi:hypothetical protein
VFFGYGHMMLVASEVVERVTAINEISVDD